jgi:protein-tyrosine phosphatase
MCDKIEKDVNEIIPRLWLGNIKAAYDKQFLKKYKIKHVLTVMPNFNENYRLDDIDYLVFPIKDQETCSKNMINFFEIANKFILNGLQKGEAVLVHCKQGHHRSATIVAAFLIKYLKVDYSTACTYINNLRPCALKKDKCVISNLFDYYLHISGTKCTKSCGMRNNMYFCECH